MSCLTFFLVGITIMRQERTMEGFDLNIDEIT
jgi:hypothetical protein